jgi:hypothetical protein
MRHGPMRLGWLGLLAGALVAGPAAAQSKPAADRGSRIEDRTSPKEDRGTNEPRIGSRSSVFDLRSARALVPLDGLPPKLRDKVRPVLDKPMLFAQGPVEVFPGSAQLYGWLLDHPDRGVQAWRRLGAKCSEIADRGNGHYAWCDGQGGDLTWQVLCRDESRVVWYAEGKVCPTPLLPAVPFQAVVVLRHGEVYDPSGHRFLRHQANIFFQSDSKTAALVTRLLGASAPHLAEEGLAQLELFFSGLVWYCEQYPERAEALFAARR